MSFDLARTPTLEAVAIDDERQLAHDLRRRVEESILLADSQPEVVEAIQSSRAAENILDRLRKAERSLSQFAKDLHEQAAANAQTAVDALVESAASGGKPDFKKFQSLAAIENQIQLTARAIQRIVEHRMPQAQIAALREESHAAMARSRAVERIAQERAERVLEQLRDAVTEEMVLPVDLSKGVAGALLAQAAGFKRIAVQLAENADTLERSYAARETR